MKITVRDAARLLGVPEKTIYRWIDERGLPVHRVHGQHRFNRAELLEWATAQGVRVSAELFPETQDDETPLPSLESALTAGGVHFLKGGADRETVLHEVVRVLDLPERVDREFLYEVLLARENLGSTAVGDGIAIPHVRNPVLLH
ncbi:MAG: helix-turn-helix domain-containing protein, partial [Myxococcota bacterium]